MGRIARRGPKAIPIIDKERNEKFKFLTVGADVEVTSDEAGFKGAWYEAEIVSHSNRKDKFSVRYRTLVSEDDPNEPLTETMGVSFLRPLPPPRAARQIYEPDDVVDAFHRDGWWKGVVSKVEVRKYKRKLRRRYTVDFKNPTEQFNFNGDFLRFHHVWVDGRWVKHPKQKALPNIIQCEEEEEKEESAHEEEEEAEEESAGEEEEKESAREEEEKEEESAGREKEEESAGEEEEESAGEEEEEKSAGEEEEESAHEEEEQSAHVSLKGSSTSDNHGEEQSSVKKSKKNPVEQVTSPSTTSTSTKQKIPAPEIEETLPSYSNKFKKENSSNHLSPDECRATSMLMNSTEQATDSGITKGSTFDMSRDLKLAGSNSPNKRKNSVLSNRTRCAEQSAHVSFKGSSTADNHSEKESAVEKSRDNPVGHSSPFCATSTSKKLKMEAPETEGRLPIYSNKFRTENCANILSPDECHATSMLMDSTEQVTDSAIIKCSTSDTSRNLQLAGSNSPNKGKSSGRKQQEPGSENGVTESSKKSERELNAQVTGQQVPTAAGEDETNEDPAEVINEGKAETFNQSSSVNGEAGSEPGRNKDPPFTKSSYMWKHIDSLEIFRILPQKPHFNFLSDCNEETREGSAIGHMLTFASLVEKVTNLQIDDPSSRFDCYLEALAILEEIGFDVKTVVDRVNELLLLKRKQEQLDNRSKRYQSLVAECDEKKAKLEQEIAAIDKMSGLVELRALKVSQMVKEISSRDFLQLQFSSIKDAMFDLEHEFKVKSAAPWQAQRVVI